ncbi:MAG: helix-turn-helix transcriptional regulator [Methylocystis sp.]|uniref:helix-turn-helix transcriptional regulator n=1 Tax=Methylocystis sp. TaxID=1911079 RepID=UPI003DA48556
MASTDCSYPHLGYNRIYQFIAQVVVWMMRVNPNNPLLIDLIYAAALGERPWQDFVDNLCPLLPNGKAFLFFHDAAARAGGFALSAGLEPNAARAYGDYYCRLNPWMQGASTRPLGRAVRADSMLPRQELMKTEFYSDFLRPLDVVSGVGVTISRDLRRNLMLSILSADADEDVFEEATRCVQALVPHLNRVLEWYRGDQMGAAALLNGKGLCEHLRAGMIGIGAHRKIQGVNDIATEILKRTPELSIDCTGRLHCVLPAVIDCIDVMLSSWTRELPALSPTSFLLPREKHTLPLRVTVLSPPSDRETAFFRGPECVLVLEEAIADMSAAIQEFSALHQLTEAEAHNVAGLAEGQSLNDIADLSGKSVETVRKQIKHVFAKTGMSRQVDLVRNICFLAGTVLRR